MQQERRKLTLKTLSPEAQVAAAETAIVTAIDEKRCLTGTYNGTNILFAPHILYSKHGELHSDAVVLLRNEVTPRELKVGTFKLAGLKSVRLTNQRFDVQPMFDPADERYTRPEIAVSSTVRLDG